MSLNQESRQYLQKPVDDHLAEVDALVAAAEKAERYLASLPDDPEPGDPKLVSIWYQLRRALRPFGGPPTL